MVYKKGILSYLLMVVLFGLPMGLLFSLMSFNLILGMGIGLAAGLLFSVLMFAFSKKMESDISVKRSHIAQERKIICDGDATIVKNGGWMFLTQFGLEFYPHKFNLSTQNIFIPIEKIQSVSVNRNKINVQTNGNGFYIIIVSKAKKWKEQIDGQINNNDFN